MINTFKLERMQTQLGKIIQSPERAERICEFIKENKVPDNSFSDRDCIFHELVKSAVVKDE